MQIHSAKAAIERELMCYLFCFRGFRKRGGLHCVWQVVTWDGGFARSIPNLFFFFFLFSFFPFYYFYFCFRLSSRLSLSQKRKPDPRRVLWLVLGVSICARDTMAYRRRACKPLFCYFFLRTLQRVCAHDPRVSLLLFAVFKARYCGGDLQDVDFGGGGGGGEGGGGGADNGGEKTHGLTAFVSGKRSSYQRNGGEREGPQQQVVLGQT